MRYAYSVEQIRAAEEAAFAVVGDQALMQRAAAGLAAVVKRMLAGHGDARVLIVAGPGNNGGDGLWAGVRLLRRGIRVDASCVLGRTHQAGWEAFLAAGGRALDFDQTRAGLARYDVVVDAGFGIGGREGLKGELRELAAALGRTPQRPEIVAVDLPSGMDADRVRPGSEVFDADVTVTFGGYKLCQVAEPARSRCGRVELVDIGLEFATPTLACFERDDLARTWPYPDAYADKYSRGVAGVAAGSDEYPGAGVLATAGAAYAGAGMVRYLGPQVPSDLIKNAFPNVVHGSGRCQAYLAGPGWGEHTAGAELTKLLDEDLPMVVDADGLRHLPERVDSPHVLLTPHAGELARLLGRDRTEVEGDPVTAVREAAARIGATVLLKGATQYVAEPDPAAPIWLAVTGPAWTGQAGSGDVLAGVCTTLLAAGLSPREAALCGASVQALTAAAHPGPHPPQELARWFPDTIAQLERESHE